MTKLTLFKVGDIMKKACNSCNKDFEDFGHEHLKTCMNCNKPSISEQNKKFQENSKKLKNFPLTTSIQFARHEIDDELGIVTAECVFGMNLFRDMFAGIRDIVGGRSAASQKVLRDLRNTCLTELKQEAFDLGADGVIAVDLDYQEFSGGGKGMLFLVASGTAVKFKK